MKILKISRIDTDPTGQARNRKKANADLSKRLTAAKIEVKNLFRKIPFSKRSVQVNEVITDYEITPEQEETLREEIALIIAVWLQTTTARVPPNWFYTQYVEEAYRSGTIQESVSLNREISKATQAGQISGVQAPSETSRTFSLTYGDKLNTATIRNYNLIQGLSNETSKQVYQQITDGIETGLTKKAILQSIDERFNVAKSSAERIVNTEVNKIYNDARIDTAIWYRDEVGVNNMVIHISALLPTTRTNHAARHGNTYTPEAQRNWWNSGANRINCYCSVRAVIVTEDGVLDAQTQEKIREKGQDFFG